MWNYIKKEQSDQKNKSQKSTNGKLIQYKETHINHKGTQKTQRQEKNYRISKKERQKWDLKQLQRDAKWPEEIVDSEEQPQLPQGNKKKSQTLKMTTKRSTPTTETCKQTIKV